MDPRGPSLWMGNAGSGTQAHYDVADNVLVQLYGLKRVRCYHPRAATALHVFPDAHPRARKSQVNFDDKNNEMNTDRFPFFGALEPPVLDVVLRPGDALRIPAFWFHHVENGCWGGLCEGDDAVREPSVSVNIFALSNAMIISQGIFRDASEPFAGGAGATSSDYGDAFAVSALRALGWALLKGLEVRESPADFIRVHILEARYGPLRQCHETGVRVGHEARRLSLSEAERVKSCIARILPQFDLLRQEDDYGDLNDIVLLVACHVLELWAVELVGAPLVADAWEVALDLDV